MPEQTPILNPIVDDQAKLFAARVVDLLRDGEAPIVPEYLTPAEAATYINYPLKTLEHWRARDEGPAFTRHGRHVRYHVDDLRAFMREGLIQPKGAAK
jgi:excisionase family DNA binding protein